MFQQRTLQQALDQAKHLQQTRKTIGYIAYDLITSGYNPQQVGEALDAIFQTPPVQTIAYSPPALAGYVIWYTDGISDYPAAGKFNVKEIFNNVENAEREAAKLAQNNPALVFGVYPVNFDWDIIGPPVKKFPGE